MHRRVFLKYNDNNHLEFQMLADRNRKMLKLYYNSLQASKDFIKYLEKFLYQLHNDYS